MSGAIATEAFQRATSPLTSSQHDFIDLVNPRPSRRPPQPCIVLNKVRQRKTKKSAVIVTQDAVEVLEFRDVLSGFGNAEYKAASRTITKKTTVDKETALALRKEATAKRKAEREAAAAAKREAAAAAAAKALLPTRAKTITELSVRMHASTDTEMSSGPTSKENRRISDFFPIVKPATPRAVTQAKCPTKAKRKRVELEQICEPLLDPADLSLRYKQQKFTYASPPQCSTVHPLFISQLHGICRNLWTASGPTEAAVKPDSSFDVTDQEASFDVIRTTQADAQEASSSTKPPWTSVANASRAPAPASGIAQPESIYSIFNSTQEYLSFLADDDDPFTASQGMQDFPIEQSTDAEHENSLSTDAADKATPMHIESLFDEAPPPCAQPVICIDDNLEVASPVKEHSLIVLSSSEDDVSLAKSDTSFAVARAGPLAPMDSADKFDHSILMIPSSDEEDSMPLQQLLSAKKAWLATPAKESRRVLPMSPLPAPQSTTQATSRIPSFPETRLPAPRPAPAEQVSLDYEVFTTLQLQTQLDKYGFKAIKQRSSMIALLTRCYDADPAARARAFGTSASTAAKKKASPKKAANATDVVNATTSKSPKKLSAKSKAPVLSKEDRAALRAEQAAEKSALKAVQAAEKVAQRQQDKVRLAEDKVQRQTQLQADIEIFLTGGVCTEGIAWYAKILTYEPIVLEDFVAAFGESAWYRRQPACAEGLVPIDPLFIRGLFDSKGVCSVQRVTRRGINRKKL